MTTSLGRLPTSSGQRDEARTILAAIYNWFTEGFDTAELQDTKALLGGAVGAPRLVRTEIGTRHASSPASRPPSGGGLVGGIQTQTLPFAGRQLQDQPRRMRRYALDHVAQIDERIYLQLLAGLNQ